MAAKKTASPASATSAVSAEPTTPAAPAVEDRVAFLENAVRVLATSLYGPNGGGDGNVAEAAALYEALCGAEVVEEPAAEAEAEAPVAEGEPA